LDVACGPGHIAAAAARRGARVTGVDFSAPMLAEARRHHPDLEFNEGDAEALPLGDATMDAVTIGFGMLHFARPERALGEARRVLGPGGHLAFTVWDVPERAPLFGMVRQAVEAHGRPDVPLPPGPDFFAFSEPTTARRALADAGLEPVEIRTLPLI